MLAEGSCLPCMLKQQKNPLLLWVQSGASKLQLHLVLLYLLERLVSFCYKQIKVQFYLSCIAEWDSILAPFFWGKCQQTCIFRGSCWQSIIIWTLKYRSYALNLAYKNHIYKIPCNYKKKGNLQTCRFQARSMSIMILAPSFKDSVSYANQFSCIFVLFLVVCPSSSLQDLKTLEPTFQLALYSARCYGRLTRIFTWHEAEFGKPMKQSVSVILIIYDFD